MVGTCGAPANRRRRKERSGDSDRGRRGKVTAGSAVGGGEVVQIKECRLLISFLIKILIKY